MDNIYSQQDWYTKTCIKEKKGTISIIQQCKKDISVGYEEAALIQLNNAK